MRQQFLSHRKTSSRIKRRQSTSGEPAQRRNTSEIVNMQRRLVITFLLMTLIARASSLDTEVETPRRLVGLTRDIERKRIRSRL